MNDLTEIRCPFKRRSKHDNKLYTCNHLCVKVYPGSSGEAWCSSCKLVFDFTLDDQSKRNIFVVAKTVPQPTE